MVRPCEVHNEAWKSPSDVVFFAQLGHCYTSVRVREPVKVALCRFPLSCPKSTPYCVVCQARCYLLAHRSASRRQKAPHMPDSEKLYQPHDVAARLGVSPSSLRGAAGEWGDLLSDYANPPGDDPRRRKRLYTAKDVAILERILDLRKRGVAPEAIAEQLAVDPPVATLGTDEQVEAPAGSSERRLALDPFVQLAQAQLGQIEDVLERLRTVERELADLRVTLARLDAQQHDHPGIVPTRRR